jgi:Domain of unknown function (DUF4390)
MKRSVSLALVCVLLVMLLAPASLPAAQDARLTDVIVTNTQDDLLLYMKVEGAFTKEMEEAVLSGVPTTFSFVADLYQVRHFWFDHRVAWCKVTHTIKYDKLKKVFIVYRSWDPDPQVTQSFEEAKKLMSEVDSLKIVALSRLQKGVHYQMRAKAELNKRTLPFNLHYVLFFMSLWDFETDWYTIDFVY